jgi:hypothetical protein
MRMVGMALGCCIGNFLWQTVAEHDWRKAADRSYFQALALGLVYLTMI